jgi:hypothetical protein
MRMSDHGPGPGPGLGGNWREEPSSWVDPHQVHVTRIDVPFLELTWFFIKSSLALALAFSVTSWLWVMIATGIASLLAGLLYLVGVPQLVTGQSISAPAAVVAPAPPEEGVVVGGEPVLLPTPTADPPPSEAAPAPPAEAQSAPDRTTDGAPAPQPAGDPDASATEALQREELERLRRARR